MQVVVIPDHRAPVVTHMVWYKVGAADETAGQSGIAHFLEHLMFKGTATHPGDEFRRRVAAIGGDENAFTSYDYTAYFQRVAKENLGEMMGFEADRMTNLVADGRDGRDRARRGPERAPRPGGEESRRDPERRAAPDPLSQSSLRPAGHRLEPRDPGAQPHRRRSISTIATTRPRTRCSSSPATSRRTRCAGWRRRPTARSAAARRDARAAPLRAAGDRRRARSPCATRRCASRSCSASTSSPPRSPPRPARRRR